MRLSPAATVCAVLGVTLTLMACAEQRTPAVDGATARQAGPAGASGPRGPAAGDSCRDELHDLIVSMDALRERLAIGLNYEDYLREVKRLEAVYEQIPVGRLAIGCLTTAGTPGERALNRYRSAANTWGECLAQASCGAEEVEPELQRRWALASDLLSTAQAALR
ncbi:MAG TPA: hypothetical protein VN752_09935 [Solirubrobacterales bacterium]|nr:hypothetical protein [Solirubrobacterales bacterium]